MDSESNLFWDNRALLLNKTPLQGQFEEIPIQLMFDGKLSATCVLNGLSDDWRRFVRMFCTSIIKEPTSNQSSAVYVYLNHKIEVGQQTFKRFFMGTLLRQVIFGSTFNSPKVQNNIVYRSKNKVYLYFPSYKSLEKVLDLNLTNLWRWSDILTDSLFSISLS